MLMNPMVPVKRVKPPAQAVNFARSASGRPSSSQITASGSCLDEVGGYALREQSVGELVGDGEDARLHLEDGATAEGFVNNVAQPPVIRFVH